MMNKKFLVTSMLVLMMSMMFASCSVLDSLFADKVVTTISNVREDRRSEAVPADLGMLPPDVAARMAKDGETLVVVDKNDILDPMGDVVDIIDPGSEALDSVLGMGLGALNSVFPGVAALEGLGLLFSKRKRKHYGKAMKAAVPANGKVELKDAVLSLGKAIGVAHSSGNSKKVFEEEEEKEEPTEAVKQVEEFLRLGGESSVPTPPTPTPSQPIKTQKEIEDEDALRQVEEFIRLQREQETAPTPTPKPTSKPTFIRPEAIGRIRGKKEIAKAIAMLNYFSKQDKKPPYYRSLAKSIITYTKKEYPTYDSSYIDSVIENVPIMGKNLSRGEVDDILIDEALVLIKTTLKGDRDDSIKIVSSKIDLESERAMKKIKNKLGDEGAFNNIERFIRKDVRVFDKTDFMRKNIEEIKTTQFLRREGLSLPPMEKKKSEDSDEDYQEYYWDD